MLEDRPNLGDEPSLCAVGGMIDPGETRNNAQVREAGEEAELDTRKAFKLAGVPCVPDRLLFVADIANDEGVVAYALELSFDVLDPTVERGMYCLRGAALSNMRKRDRLVFMDWRDAVRASPDAIARAAIAQLLADIL